MAQLSTSRRHDTTVNSDEKRIEVSTLRTSLNDSITNKASSTPQSHYVIKSVSSFHPSKSFSSEYNTEKNNISFGGQPSFISTSSNKSMLLIRIT